MPACERLVAAALRAADRRDALRPFVDREEAADAVAGAVGVIEARFPQRPAGEAVELRLPRVPLGNTAVAMAIWPLSTRVKRSRISSVGSPIGTVRVMSVVPSTYWPPESIR